MAGANSSVPGAYNTGVYFEVGGRVFSWDDPDHMVSLNVIKQVSDCCLSFTMEVYDETSIEVEQAIFSVWPDGPYYLEYGYSEVPILSKRYKVMITKVLPNFDITGTTMTIEGRAWIEEQSKKSATDTATEPNTNTGKTYYGNPDEIFKQVAEEEGWIKRRIVPCQPISPDGYTDDQASQGKWSAFRPSNMSAHVFIDQYVAPYAIDFADRGSFRCLLEIDGDETHSWFMPAEEFADLPSKEYEYTVGYPDNKIIRWTPSTNGIIYHCGGSNLEVSSIDTISGETNTTTINANSSGATIHVPISSCSKEELENRAKALYVEANTALCTGDLEVVGDPTLAAGTYVNLMVYTSHGQAHRSSGKYWVQSIEDVIEMGKYSSTMSMMKMGNINYSSVSSSKRNASGGGGFGGGGGVRGGVGGNTSSSVGMSNIKNFRKGRSIGHFRVTAYCPCKKCCGNYSYEVTGKMNKTGLTGDIPSEGRTIAVDPSAIPAGDWVCWEDPKTKKLELRRAEDKGGAIDGLHIDLYFKNHSDAVNYGTQYVDIYEAIIEYGTSPMDKLPTSVLNAMRDGKFSSSEIAAIAEKYLGIPYVLGAADGDMSCMDCSSLVKQMTLDLGYGQDFTSYTGTMRGMGVSVGTDPSNWQPGDWIFTNGGGHVGMYVGDGYWVAASSKKGCVTYQEVAKVGGVVDARRVW